MSTTKKQLMRIKLDFMDDDGWMEITVEEVQTSSKVDEK